MSLDWEARKLKRQEQSIEKMEKDLEAERASFKAHRKAYEDEWFSIFNQKLDDAGRTWCTYCDLIILKEKAQERYQAYGKSDYGGSWLESLTKHRVCSTCAEDNVRITPKEAKKMSPMFHYDDTKGEPQEKTVQQAIDLFDMPPLDPTKE